MNEGIVEKIGDIVVPEAYRESGVIKDIASKENPVEALLERVINQSSALGKRALPTKDSTDSEWQEFAGKLLTNVVDEDYDFEELGDSEKAKFLSAFKNAGIAPKQAKQAIDAYKDIIKESASKKYSVDEFKVKAQELFANDPAGFDKATAVLREANIFSDVFDSPNEERLLVLKAAAAMGKAFLAKETPAGSTSGNAPIQTPAEREAEYRKELKSLGNVARDVDNPKTIAIMKKYGKIGV